MEFVDLSQKKSLHINYGNEGKYCHVCEIILRQSTQHQK